MCRSRPIMKSWLCLTSQFLWMKSPGGEKKGGFSKILKFRVGYRNICRKVRGIQWCNPFFDILNIKQVTAILRLFFAKKIDFWSPITDPQIHIKKISTVPFTSIFYPQTNNMVKNNRFLYLIPKKNHKVEKINRQITILIGIN